MEICAKCGRRIARTRKGRGGFRRHMKSKGVLCPGSWEYPHKQEEELRQRAQQKMHPTKNGRAENPSLYLVPPFLAGNLSRWKDT